MNIWPQSLQEIFNAQRTPLQEQINKLKNTANPRFAIKSLKIFKATLQEIFPKAFA